MTQILFAVRRTHRYPAHVYTVSASSLVAHHEGSGSMERTGMKGLCLGRSTTPSLRTTPPLRLTGWVFRKVDDASRNTPCVFLRSVRVGSFGGLI